MQKRFDNNPVYNEKYLKTKTKYYGHKLNTNLNNNGIPKECCHCVCLSVKFIDFVFYDG